MLRVRFRPFGLATLQVFRILGQGGELALDRRALEQLLTPLELAAQLLLRLRQALQRLACGLRIETRQRFLQLAQPLLELRRERPLQQLLHFAQAILERAVIDARRLCRARDLLDRLRQLLDALRHRRLIAGDLLGALRGLERHRALLLVAAWPRARPPIRITTAFLREIAGPVAQLSLGGGDGVRGVRHRPRGSPRFRAQLLHAGQAQRDLGTATDMWRWRVIERFDIKPQRVTGQQPAVFGVEPPLHDRAVTDAADIERLADCLADAAGAAHPPAHDGKSRDPVIVAHIGDQLLMERNRQRRVASRHRDRHDGSGIGHDQQVQLRRRPFER